MEEGLQERGLDREAFEQAQAEADRRFPLPKNTPTGGAIRYGIGAFLAVLSMELFLPIIGLWWSGFVTIALGAAIGWSDTNSTYRANSREFRELYNAYRQTRR